MFSLLLKRQFKQYDRKLLTLLRSSPSRFRPDYQDITVRRQSVCGDKKPPPTQNVCGGAKATSRKTTCGGNQPSPAPNSNDCKQAPSKGDCGGGGKGNAPGKSKHTLNFVPYKNPPKKCHDAKNMELKRPMSPHLTIYAPTLPAMTSIVQRITGVMVYGFTLLLASGSLFLSNGVETYVSMIQSLDMSRPTIFLIKIILGAPFVYHYFNGMRFVVWNTGRKLAMKDVYITAKQSFVATVVLTTIFALL